MFNKKKSRRVEKVNRLYLCVTFLYEGLRFNSRWFGGIKWLDWIDWLIQIVIVNRLYICIDVWGLVNSALFFAKIGIVSKWCKVTAAVVVKEKYLRGAFWRTGSFILPLEPSLGTIPLSSALSVLYTLCVAQLLLTPSRIIPLRSAQPDWRMYSFSSRKDACVCTINHTWSYGGGIFPQMACTSCNDPGSNLQPPDERADTLKVSIL